MLLTFRVTDRRHLLILENHLKNIDKRRIATEKLLVSMDDYGCGPVAVFEDALLQLNLSWCASTNKATVEELIATKQGGYFSQQSSQHLLRLKNSPNFHRANRITTFENRLTM